MRYNRLLHLFLLSSYATLCVAATAAFSRAAECPALADSDKQGLVAYVRGKYKLSESISLQLSKDEPFANTCYRRLTFQGVSKVRTWELALYLSPDRRFLTDKLYDTTVDPVAEERRNAEKLMTGLSAGNVPSLGPSDAPVTIVEFSDFQCPFCRRFEEIQKQVLAADGGRLRVVFHYLPLSVHPWARTAAQGAACAELQSPDAFWPIHDQLFQEQSGITPDNIKSRLLEYAGKSKKVDMQAFRRCMDDDLSLGLVLRDMNLATSNQISGTPTLFINGRRIQGVKDAAELRGLIMDAEKDAAKAAAAASSAGLNEASLANEHSK